MKVFAFDRDGTVETSRGVVPLSFIKKLKEKNYVYAIGNPKLCKEAGIKGIEKESKEEKLNTIAKKHPEADRFIVVDNDKLEVQGWKYYSPKEFVKKYIGSKEKTSKKSPGCFSIL